MEIKGYSEFINEETQFPSAHNIGDFVTFTPTAKQSDERMIEREPRFGNIVKVSFSKAKVFYDVLDDYFGEIFTDIDSSFIKPETNKKISEKQ